MRKHWRWAALAAALLVALVYANGQRGEPTPLDRAQRLVAQASNFDTGREAGDTLVFAATQLVREAGMCIDRDGETPYCLAFRSAAAWSNVAGVKALSCRAPGRFKLRSTAVKFYADLEKLSRRVSDIPPTPPLPQCE